MASERAVSARLLDELLPQELEWERVVRTYPLTSLVVAGVAGYLLAVRSGAPILAAVGATATRRVADLMSSGVGDGAADYGARVSGYGAGD
jgi:hypothetical protein